MGVSRKTVWWSTSDPSGDWTRTTIFSTGIKVGRFAFRASIDRNAFLPSCSMKMTISVLRWDGTYIVHSYPTFLCGDDNMSLCWYIQPRVRQETEITIPGRGCERVSELKPVALLEYLAGATWCLRWAPTLRHCRHARCRRRCRHSIHPASSKSARTIHNNTLRKYRSDEHPPEFKHFV